MSILIATDFHCKYQKVAWMDTEDGEIRSGDVMHQDVQAVREFYRQFPAGSVVGMESSGYSHWFEELVLELGLELRIGNSQEIASRRVRRQKNDDRDAVLMLQLLASGLSYDVAARPIRSGTAQGDQPAVPAGTDANAVDQCGQALAYSYSLAIRRDR